MNNALEERLNTAGDNYYGYYGGLVEAAEMLHERHEQALDERNLALEYAKDLEADSAELSLIRQLLDHYAPWTDTGDDDIGPAERVEALIRAYNLRSVEQ